MGKLKIADIKIGKRHRKEVVTLDTEGIRDRATCP